MNIQLSAGMAPNPRTWPLFDGGLSSQQWQNLAVTGGLWFLLPLVIGLLVVRRAEVK